MANTRSKTLSKLLTLRRTVEESYQFLEPLYTAGHRVKKVMLTPHGDFRASIVSSDSPLFVIDLPLAEVVSLDNSSFLLYLTRRWIECMPDSVRAYNQNVADKWATESGKRT